MFSWKTPYKLNQIIFVHGQIETRIWRIYSAHKFREFILHAIKGKSEFVAWNFDYFNLSVIEKISSETRLMIQWRSLAKGRVYWLDLPSQIVDSDPSQCKWSNDKLHYASSNFLIDVHTVYHKKFKELLYAWNWAKLPGNCIIRIRILRHSFTKMRHYLFMPGF